MSQVVWRPQFLLPPCQKTVNPFGVAPRHPLWVQETRAVWEPAYWAVTAVGALGTSFTTTRITPVRSLEGSFVASATRKVTRTSSTVSAPVPESVGVTFMTLPSLVTVADPRTCGLPTRVISPPVSANGLVTHRVRSKEAVLPTRPSRSTISEIVMGGRVEAITVTGMVMLTGSVEPS